MLGPRKARRRTIWLLIAVILFAQIALAQETETTEATATATATATSTSDSTTEKSTTTEATTTESKTTKTEDSKTTTSDKTTSASSTSTNDYPVVTVPPLAGAPYMQTSDTPEGTVFIAVGAVLGAMGLAVLAWRGMVAWSVNRSVRKAAIMQSSEAKGLLRSRRKRSSHRAHGNAVSLDKLGSSGQRGSDSHSQRHSRASKTPRATSGLFFSPTAGVHGAPAPGGSGGPGNRGSSYLPAGYYAAGAAAGGAGGGSHQSMRFSASDLPGLGPQAQGYTRTKSGPSPPGTPTGVYESQFNTSRHSHLASNSSVNLSSPGQARTPSAYLEDLFENHPPQDRDGR
ncbi:hypothetical protein BDV25DRAFT_150841 [Aspergillus avenaceus]|uniref:Transmembrane protein n=1 Tax=Aspergillus avenaceus TaxID=36643 RepID=A0A5N6U1T9_ASPAV|nr:hypothetical protein BDV25DRAFT_150841 [Aspergillus avenaceus]